MRAVYPGSFNPWHKGHTDILTKALEIFQQVDVTVMSNPAKQQQEIDLNKLDNDIVSSLKKYPGERVCVQRWHGLLADRIKASPGHYNAIIRGLRNGSDLQYEQNMQYWNEDLGLNLPVVYFVCDRNLAHISSSAIRSIENFKK